MSSTSTLRPRRSIRSGAAACALALAATSVHGDELAIGTRRAADLSGIQLEQFFWVCDYVATTRGVHATPATACVEVTDELKRRKFAGDFEQLLGWWRRNKNAEHRRLDTAARK